MSIQPSNNTNNNSEVTNKMSNKFKSMFELMSALPELDFRILSWYDNSPNGMHPLWRAETCPRRHQRNGAHWLALGGIFPARLRAAHAAGKLATIPGTHWAEFLPTEFDEDAIILVDEGANRELLEKVSARHEVLNFASVYAELLSEFSGTVEDYLGFIDGLKVEDGWSAIKLDLNNFVRVKGDLIKVGTTEYRLRKFVTANGNIISPDAAMILVLNYLLTPGKGSKVNGRIAFLSDAFVNEVSVGFSHGVLDMFLENTAACLEVDVSPKGYFTSVKRSREVAQAARAWEGAGHSVFMHKGGKYLVVDAEGAGFGRVDGESVVAWYADKWGKITGRNLFSVATAKVFREALVESKVKYLDLEGKSHSFSGVPFTEAMVASPLLELCGSGGALSHPEATRQFCVKKAVSCEVPFGSEDPMELVTCPEPGQSLSPGDVVFRYRGMPIARWDSLVDGMVVSMEPKITVAPESGLVRYTVNCIELVETGAEKFRGPGKWRADGGFHRDVRVTRSDDGTTVYNPNVSLAESVEHCVGAEEFKTLNYALGMIGATWDGRTGRFEDGTEARVEDAMVRVDVEVWNLDLSVWEMLKDTTNPKMHGSNPAFEFPEPGRAIHRGAFAWVGEQVQLVETPLTHTFVGRCASFAEQNQFFGIEFPEVHELFTKSIEKNQERVLRMLEMVDGTIEGRFLVVDAETLVTFGGKTLRQVDGVVGELGLEDDVTIDTFRRLAAALKKVGVDGFQFESQGYSGDNTVTLDLEAFVACTGAMSSRPMTAFFNLLSVLAAPSEKRRSGGWETLYHRSVGMLRGALEVMVLDSPSLLGRATKTEEFCFTLRAGATVHNSVAHDELHLHPRTLGTFGFVSGDEAFIWRVPVPGIGRMRLVSNDRVPFGVGLMSAAMKHAIEEGDVDGDSIIGVVIRDGEVVRPCHRLGFVDPNGGNA